MRIRPLLSLFLICVLTACISKQKHWDYEGVHNPSHWHEISKESKVCLMGHHQSPIDINPKKTLQLSQELKIFYHEALMKIINTGHVIEFDTTDSHYILLNGKRYDLQQFHFHAHSEHSINKKYYPAEMHLVHQAKDSETVVLSVYQNVFESERSHHIFDQIPKIGKHSFVKLDLASLIPKNRSRYVYDGSLTTPPSTENVTWLVFKNPVKISEKELDKFRKFYTSNYRPIQKEHLRLVYDVDE